MSAIPIFLGHERFEAPASEMTGAELRRLFRLPADDLLYRAQGSKVEGNPIEDADNVVLKSGMHFISVPRNITGGAISLDEVPSAQRDELELIQNAYPGAALEREGGALGIVVPFTDARWLPAPLLVLVKVPPLYPQQPPDLIFLDAAAHLRDGSAVPRKMQDHSFAGRMWQQVSWHFGGPFDITRRNLLGFVHSVQRYLSSSNP